MNARSADEDDAHYARLERMFEKHVWETQGFFTEQREVNAETRESLMRLGTIVCGDGDNVPGLAGDMRDVKRTLSGVGWRVLAAAGTVLAGAGAAGAWFFNQFGVHLASGKGH